MYQKFGTRRNSLTCAILEDVEDWLRKILYELALTGKLLAMIGLRDY